MGCFWEFPTFWGSHGPREDIPPLTPDQSEKLIVFRKESSPEYRKESINAALIEEQNMKLNQIASEERSGLLSAQTENPVLSALADRLQEINLKVGRLQEASAVTARKSEEEFLGVPLTTEKGDAFPTPGRRQCTHKYIMNSQIKKVDLPTYLGVTLDPELRFSKHIEQTANKALGKLNILRKLSGTSWGSRPQTLKSTFCTVIRPVLEYETPICTPASFSVKRKLDSVQHRAAKIIIRAVSSTNNEKAEQECGLPPLKSRRKLAIIKFTNKLRSYELNLEHSSLEFLQEPLIPKNPPNNTCFELELLQPCSKKEDPVTLRQKGLETIAILSQDNFAIAYTDGSSDRSLSNGGAGILLLLPDGNNYKHKINTGIIASNFTSKLMAIREALILYQPDPHVIDSTE
ncbi:RNase H domain-containing protein [Trichonephila clavipes]|nr:RNase H domain-containing protein [Trichonephila clavipes]